MSSEEVEYADVFGFGLFGTGGVDVWGDGGFVGDLGILREGDMLLERMSRMNERERERENE